MEKTKKSQEGKKMIDNFMSVLEEFSGANLHSEAARKTIAEALIKHMCEHHIITYTDLDSARKDPKMEQWVSYCKTKKQETNPDQMELPFEKGL